MDSRSVFSPSRTAPNDIRNSGPLSPREPPACVQNAMMKERKPFTYTPGGLDLSEIRSEKMARRLMINAMSPGVQEKPKPPSFTPTSETPPVVKPALHYFNMPVAVFPCIQIPANPKELLRRTSGPYGRSDSVEKREFSPQKQKEDSVNGAAENKVDAKFESKTEPKIESKVEPKFESKFQPKVEQKVEPKFEPKVEPKFEPKVEPKFEPKIEAKFEPKVEPKFEPKVDAKIDAKVEKVIPPIVIDSPLKESPEKSIEVTKEVVEEDVPRMSPFKEPVAGVKYIDIPDDRSDCKLENSSSLNTNTESSSSFVFDNEVAPTSEQPMQNDKSSDTSDSSDDDDEEFIEYELLKQPVKLCEPYKMNKEMTVPETVKCEEKIENMSAEKVKETVTKEQDMVIEKQQEQIKKESSPFVEKIIDKVNRQQSPFVEKLLGRASKEPSPAIDKDFRQSSPFVEKLSGRASKEPSPFVDKERCQPSPFVEKLLGRASKESSPIVEKMKENSIRQQSPFVEKMLGKTTKENSPFVERVIGNKVRHPSPFVEKIIDRMSKEASPVVEKSSLDRVSRKESPFIERNSEITSNERNTPKENLIENKMDATKVSQYDNLDKIMEMCLKEEKLAENNFSKQSIIEDNNTNENYDTFKPEVVLRPKPTDRNCTEERTPSPYRKSMEIIKGLSDDLDKLPNLDMCPKRFSFLSESPVFEEPKKEEDVFSILTGIPPKISLIDRVDTKKRVEPIKETPVKIEILPPWKSEKSDATEEMAEKKQFEPAWKKVARLKEDFRAPSPFKANSNDFWKNDSWNNRDNTPSPIKAFLKDDKEPAWKKELRDIAQQKAESREESEENKVNEEPPWRRELRELSLARGAKSLPIKEINLEEVIEPPWKANINQYRPMALQEKPKMSPPPTWSQTLRPKSWKERNTELKQNNPPEVPEWKKLLSPKQTMTDQVKNPLDRLSTFSNEVRKTPEITVEVVNQPPYKSATLPSNGYVYPWESSSDSSAAFSPEPRTPTPQSRNSPFTHGQQNTGYGYMPAIPREYGTLSFQPRRPAMRSCPIQSRSFKYLQLLTGTDDSYEDDEPFIPQPAQHALPRPENL